MVLFIKDRLWRKNRATIQGSTCLGVDINRNFPSNFGGTGSSSDPCSESESDIFIINLNLFLKTQQNSDFFLYAAYHGAAVFSEKESIALRDLIVADRGRVKAAFSMHSYAQYWMSPYSYTNTLPTDYFEHVQY